ncbi:hypothetical protein LW977_17920, partial [Erwinia amylovora]|uniref:hypothetical protein n=1 Tax=Erwinia amylovora TaxID=552 RepID=UPI0020BF11A9
MGSSDAAGGKAVCGIAGAGNVGGRAGGGEQPGERPAAPARHPTNQKKKPPPTNPPYTTSTPPVFENTAPTTGFTAC